MPQRTSVSSKRPKTPEQVENLLVERGCDRDQLRRFIDLVRLTAKGRNAFLPTRLDQMFAATIDTKRLVGIEKRLEALANELKELWTPTGEAYVRSGTSTRWMIEQPNLMKRYVLGLRQFREMFQKRRPAFHSAVKSAFVKYVRDATGRKRWHDAELALLCGEEQRTWIKWRDTHYKPPSHFTEEKPIVVELLPPPASTQI